MHGFGSYDPAEATIHIRGSGGTGMFDSVNLAGDLKGFFRPTGTLYLSYPSTDAALSAVERGLAQNTTPTRTSGEKRWTVPDRCSRRPKRRSSRRTMLLRRW